ncbi:hypothetical protein ABPG72_005291 [Tetrahymena utriculariae]
MKTKSLIIIILIFDLAFSEPYQTKYFDQLIDHLGFETGDKTFKQKYLIKDDYYRYDKGPILFYCDNEAPVEFSFGGAGFMHTTLAKELNALVVFMEHRYFGGLSPLAQKKNLLRKEIINTLLKSLGCEDNECPIVVFGASYGGMLSAWIRMKFPKIIDASLASSTPIFLYENREGVDETLFFKVVTDTYDQNGCSKQIHSAMKILTGLIGSPLPSFLFKKQYKKVLDEINQGMKTCKPITDQNNLNVLRTYIDSAYGYMSMFNYHKKVILFQRCLLGLQTILAVKKFVDVYYDFEEQKKCIHFNTGSTGDVNTSGYKILSCADIVQPIHPNGITDMFYNQPWDKDLYQQYCEETFGLTPSYDYVLNFYGGKNDDEMNDDLTIINMYAAGHCSDLRLSQIGDVERVIQARIEEEKYIKRWIQEKLPSDYFTKKSQV